MSKVESLNSRGGQFEFEPLNSLDEVCVVSGWEFELSACEFGIAGWANTTLVSLHAIELVIMPLCVLRIYNKNTPRRCTRVRADLRAHESLKICLHLSLVYRRE